MKQLLPPFKVPHFLMVLFFCFLVSHTEVFGQLTATTAVHEGDNQNQIVIRLSGNLAALYNTTAGWTVTVGGAGVTVNSVVGAAGVNQVTITLADPGGGAGVAPEAIGIGQAVVVNFGGDAAINPITNMASSNNRAIVCSDFNFSGVFDSSLPCAPVDPNTLMIFSIKPAARNSSAWNWGNIVARVYWQTQFANPQSTWPVYESNSTGAAASNSYFFSFKSADDPSNYTYPGTDAVCGYTSYWQPQIFGVGVCPITNPTQRVIYSSFNADDGNGDGQLITNPTVANTDQVCEGQSVNMSFSDQSDLNCIDDAAAPSPLPNNEAERWVRVIYGFPHTAGNTIRNVFVGGVQITDANGDLLPAYVGTGYVPLGANALGTPMDGFGVVNFPAIVTAPNNDLELITTSTPTLAGDVGRTFNITLQYWNVCNAYSSGNFANAREITDQVIVIDAPVAPTVPDRDICSTDPTTLTVSAPLGAGYLYRWWNDPVLRAPGNQLTTGTTFTPTNAQAPIGQRTHFWITVESTGVGNCRSPAGEVKLIRRPALTSPSPIVGAVNLCPSSSYTFSVASSPGNITITDPTSDPDVTLATEYFWTVPTGVDAWTIDSGNGTNTINVTTAGVKSGNVTVARRYVTAPNCSPTATSQPVNVRARPTVGVSPNPANICEGSTIQLNGNPVLPPSASGFTPSISSHTWGGAVAILDATNIQQPTVQASTAPGTYGLTYFVTANFGGGVTCSSAIDNTSVVNISSSPTPADAGPAQNLCIPAPLDATLAGSSPGVGTGTWTRVSGPGAAPTFTPNANTPNAVARVFANGVHVFRWTVVNGTCTSFDDVTIDYGTTPPVSTNGGNQDVCSLSATLSGNDPTFATGTWVQTSGPGTSSFSPNANDRNAVVTVTAFGTYTYRWRLSSGTCTPSDSFLDVIFHQAPTATGPVDFTVCVDNPPTVTIPLSGTFGGGASQARWERITGTGTFTSNGTATGNFDNSNPATDVYTPTAADFTAGSVQVRLVTDDPTGACTSVNDPVTITIDRRPTAADAGPATMQTCDPNLNLAATAANNGGTGTWSIGNALYYETFTYANGTGISGPNPHALTYTHPTANWTITAPTTNTLLASDDYMRVQSNVMETQDLNNAEFVWRSPSVNITAQPNVTVTLQLAEFGGMEATDYIRAFYRLNGTGPEIAIGSIVDDAAVDGAFNSFSVTGITGTSIEIIIRVLSNATGEIHRFDNIFIAGSGAVLPLINDVNSATTSVSNLPVGNTTFTWTVTSALGVCSSSNDQVVVTRHASPVNNNLTRGLCEDSPGSGDATVTLAYLTTLNDAITGIVGSANRTVQYFSDPARTVSYPASDVLANSDIVYTRVIRTDVTPNCPTDGTVTIQVNARPAAIDQNPEYCEDAVGSNTRTNIDLTLLNDAVKNNVVANTVTWFLSLGPDVPVPVPTNVTANDGTTFFARVTDGNGCTNEAQIEIQLNPVPPPNALLGPTDVCVDPTGVTLYQLSVNNPGYTYSWTIPDPPFDRIIGGTSTDFLVLLSFPVIVDPGQDISVIETSDKGCVGAPNIRNIRVDTSPPPITIVDATLSPGPGAVCEGENGVVYSVANLANTTYAWTVPPGSSIIAGQGTSTITVNFGTVAGLISVVPTTTTGCAGNPDDYSVAINPRPSLNVLANTVCSDAPASITLSGTGAVTYNITNVSVPPGLSPASRPLINGALSSEIFNDIFTNTTGGNLTVQYTVVPVSAQLCTGTAQIVNLTIRPEPVLAPGLFDEICSTTDAVNIVLGVASGSFPADQFEIFALNNPSGLTQVAGSQTIGVGVYHTSGVLLDDKWENLTGTPATIEYFIRPRNSSTGCVGDPPIPVTVTVNPEPVVPPMVPETICSGDSPATIITPSIAGSTFSWTVISITGVITGNTNGSGPSGTAITDILINSGVGAGSVTYAITATGPGGVGSCTGAAENLIVNVNPSPTANSISQTVCSDAAGGNTFFINLTTLQNTVNSGGGVTFTWSENISMVPLIATPAAYTLTNGVPVYVEVDNGQCTKVATVLYTINPSPSVAATITSNYNGFQLSCNGASDGQITAVPADGTGPYLFSIDGGTSFFTSGIFNGLSVTGNPYTIRVRDANSCIANSGPLTILPPVAVSATAAISSNYNGEDVSCQAASDGAITVSPAGGTGLYTFRLLELPSNTSGDASGVYSGLRAGVYTFVVRDGNNCQFTTSTVTVTEPNPIVATAVLTTPVTCNGNSNGVITVTATGGTLAGPSYSFTLNQPPGTNNATGIFNGLAAGSYTVDVEDDNGCTRTSNLVSVTQPSVLTVFSSVTSNYNGAKISCPGADDAQVTAIANGGNGGYSYVLVEDPLNTSGQTDGSFENLGPGSYTITVTDIGPCSNTSAPVTVTEPTPIVGAANVTGTISCNGGSDGQITVTATGGTGAYSYEQIVPAGPTNASGIFNGLNQGSYDFEVSDLNGCADVVTIPLTQPTAVAASAVVTSNYNGSQISCAGANNAVITVSASGGTGAFTYVFDQFALTNISGQFTGVFSGVEDGTGFTFTVRDSKNCPVVTAPITVTEPVAIAASGVVSSNYNGEDITCVGASDGQITISPSGGTGAYTFKLDQVPSNTSGDASGVYALLNAGTYTVTVRDVNSCFVVTSAITLTPPTPISATASVTSNFNGRNISCNGASDGEITVAPLGGVGGYTFELNEILGNTSGNTSGVYVTVPAGSYTIDVRDLNACLAIATVTLTQPTVLAASSAVTSNYSGEDISCNGSTDGVIKVTPTGGTTPYTYVFVEIPGNVTGASTGNFTGVPAGTFTFDVRDVNNCPVTTVPVTVTPPAPLTAVATVTSNYNGQQISCNGADDASITITPTGGTGTKLYVFNQDLANMSGNFSGTYSSVGAGTGYTFTVTDFNGCPFVTAPIDVTEPVALSASLNATSDFNGFDISCFNLSDGEISVVSLVGGTGSPQFLLVENPGNATGLSTGVFTGLRAGTYRVRITDVNGCLLTTAAVPVTQPTDISVQIQITSNYGVDQTDISCVGASDGEVSVLPTISGGASSGGGAASGIADYTYELSDVSNTSGDLSGVYTGLTNTMYSVTATDGNGCTKTSLPVVLVEPIPLFAGFVGSSHDICINQDNPDPFTIITPAFGGNGSHTYQWEESLSSTGPFTTIAGATSDTYQVPAAPALTQTTFYRRIVSTANAAPSCPSLPSNVLTITVNALPTATIENQPAVCQGTPFLLDFTFPTGAAPFTFDYETLETGSPGPPTSVVNVIGATVRPIFINDYQEETTFTITRIVDRNGCIATLPIANRTVPIIKVDADFNITSPVTQCSGSLFTFTYNVDPGVEYTFQWPDGLTDVFTPGTGTVSKTLTSFNPDTNSDLPVVLTARHPSCPALTTSQVVTIYPTIIPNLVTNPTTMCSGTPITVVNLTQGGDDHDWTIVRLSDGAVIQSILNQPNPDSQTITINNNEATALNPETYEIRYNISNTAVNGGCNDQVIVPVRVYREVVAAITPPPTIPLWNAMGIDLTFVNSSTPISGDFEYSWTFISDAVPNAFVGQTPPTIHYNQPGPNKRTRLVASNPAALADPLLLNGCQSVAEYVFTIFIPPLNADFTYTPEAACLPADIQITANNSSGDVHQWKVLNQNGVQIYVSGEVTPTFPITSPGEYRIYLTTSSSLSAAAPVTKGPEVVRVYANPTAIFEALPSVLFVPDELLRTVNSSVSPVDVMNSPTLHPIYYKWYFGDGTDTLVSFVDPNPLDELSNFAPKHQYLNEGNYDVALLAINDHGNGVVCIDTTVQRVTAKAQGFTRIPNAFTPNTSGPNGGFDNGTSASRNDVFLPIMKGIKEFKMQIFDRWGNLVFQSTRTDQGWDGYDKNGILMPAGVYVYKLELLLANDTRTTQVGDVTMIR